MDILRNLSTLLSVSVKSIFHDASHYTLHAMRHHTVIGEDADHVIITLFPFDFDTHKQVLFDYIAHYPQLFKGNLHLKWRFLQVVWKKMVDAVFYTSLCAIHSQCDGIQYTRPTIVFGIFGIFDVLFSSHQWHELLSVCSSYHYSRSESSSPYDITY